MGSPEETVPHPDAPGSGPQPSRAVFLSYASQDAQAARRICEALRAAGIEVWFDQSELRGGDAWDQMIRRQIRDCALFVPIISGNSEARPEGYFRLEWDLADQRSHMIVRHRPFIMPVCLDRTPESDAGVPESFQRVQWTRLPGGETPPAFVERVRRLLSPEPSTTVRASLPAREHAAASSRSKRFLPVAGAGLVALLVVLGFLGLERLRGSKPSIRGESIAVLPLTNESGDASQQYFSDGISEDLITALSQFSGLKVIGRASAFQFRDSREDSRSIGAKLGVAHLLEGSVRKSGDVIRVSAELIDTTDGSTQWSEHYDRPYKDLFALQDEITHAVAGALRAMLLPGEQLTAQSDRPPSGSLEAYNALLEGQFYYLRETESDFRKAIEFYALAVELDPRYAVAWSKLSRAWSALGLEFLAGAPWQEAHAKARDAAERALALAPDLAAAHLARGFYLQNADFDLRGAEAEFRRALTLAPHEGEPRFYFGRLLAALGKPGPGIDLIRQALATEPLRANWYKWLGIYLTGLNSLQEAERAISRAIELEPGASEYHLRLALIEIQRGDAQAALAAALQEPPGYFQDSALALARQFAGDRSGADAALRTLIEKDAALASYPIAQVYALRSDSNATFEWLDRAFSNHDSGVINLLLSDPIILRYKDDPRFAAFCRKVGLPVPGESKGTE